MSATRLFFLPTTACVALLVTSPMGLFLTPPSQGAGSVSSLPTEVDPDAVAVLDQALEQFGPERVSWLETNLWQQLRVKDLAYQAQGHYVAGPGQRFLIELITQVGSTEGALRVVSNGSLLWKASRIGCANWTCVHKVDVPRVVDALAGVVSPEQVRAEFLDGQSFGGIFPLLQRLRGKLNWVRKERVSRKGQELVKLTGVWNADAVREMGAADGSWPDGQPRQCRLYLDPRTSWPCRIEWWGPDSSRSAEALLLQMEFRDPVVNQPPADRGASVFCFAAESAQVVDQTPELTEKLRTRAEP
jgi:hypothetical protein